jgi:hypothetical protein
MPEEKLLLRTVVVLMAAAVLGSAFTLPAAATYKANAPRLDVSQITLYPFEECVNTVQCNARLFDGEEITFSGILVDEDSAGIPHASVNIYHLLSTETKPLVSAMTGADGTFEVKWTAQFFDKKSVGETFKQQISERFDVYAQFDGSDKYAPSRSGKLVFTVMMKDMFTFVETDKNAYKEGSSAFIFVNFIETEVREDGFSLVDFVDPDTIRATYDNKPVTLIKKKAGSYVFTTPPLELGHHQLVVSAEKAGHNSRVGFVTVHVSGFFGNY